MDDLYLSAIQDYNMLELETEGEDKEKEKLEELEEIQVAAEVTATLNYCESQMRVAKDT